MVAGYLGSLGMELGANPYDVAAIALAPVAAFISLGLRRPWHLALTLLAVGVAGYALMLASTAWADAQLVAMFNAQSNHSQEQIQRFSADGATKSVLFLFGLPLSLLYASRWFALARLVRRIRGKLFHA